jgi:hypothetical protein
MLEEYVFSQGEIGKYAKQYGTLVIDVGHIATTTCLREATRRIVETFTWPAPTPPTTANNSMERSGIRMPFRGQLAAPLLEGQLSTGCLKCAVIALR